MHYGQGARETTTDSPAGTPEYFFHTVLFEIISMSVFSSFDPRSLKPLVRTSFLTQFIYAQADTHSQEKKVNSTVLICPSFSELLSHLNPFPICGIPRYEFLKLSDTANHSEAHLRLCSSL